MLVLTVVVTVARIRKIRCVLVVQLVLCIVCRLIFARREGIPMINCGSSTSDWLRVSRMKQCSTCLAVLHRRTMSRRTGRIILNLLGIWFSTRPVRRLIVIILSFCTVIMDGVLSIMLVFSEQTCAPVALRLTVRLCFRSNCG